MDRSGYSHSPKFQKGALVQLVESLGIPLPNIVPFQYNPETMKRTLKPWNPLGGGDAGRAINAPAAQPFDPEETISLALELDASDDLGANLAIPKMFGIADRIAALEKMLLPEQSPLGAAIDAAMSLFGGGSEPPKRPQVAVTLLIWGIGRILPVRITNFSVEEKMFSTSLFPTHATITMDLAVVPPDAFQCLDTLPVKIAKSLYDFHSKSRDALAIAHIANTADELLAVLPSELRSMLPF